MAKHGAVGHAQASNNAGPSPHAVRDPPYGITPKISPKRNRKNRRLRPNIRPCRLLNRSWFTNKHLRLRTNGNPY
ncbi:hypothetical protein CR513_29575, partial [Mucuna pruriens]